jgi:hypothetical protein
MMDYLHLTSSTSHDLRRHIVDFRIIRLLIIGQMIVFKELLSSGISFYDRWRRLCRIYITTIQHSFSIYSLV